MGIELIITVILILANSASFDPVNAEKNDSVALRFGFLVGMLITAAVSSNKLHFLFSTQK